MISRFQIDGNKLLHATVPGSLMTGMTESLQFDLGMSEADLGDVKYLWRKYLKVTMEK